MKINSTYFLLGSNVGNSREHLILAAQYIQTEIGKIITASSFYRTAAWGNNNQPDFLNQVIVAETKLDAQKVLQKALSIEEIMGRIRTEKNAPRIIDIDILYFNKEIINTPYLIVPHSQIAYRRFVLVPLAAIAPLLKHPVLHKTSVELLAICTDALNVQKI